MNPPRFSVSGLKRTLLSPSLLSGGEPADDSSHQVCSSLSILWLHAIAQSSVVSTLTTKIQSKGDFWGQLQHEILVLEEALQKGSLHGLSIGRIDQYAGQVNCK